jgi:hypothetical protein
MNITIGSIAVCSVCVGPSFSFRILEQGVHSASHQYYENAGVCYWESSGTTREIIN